MLISSCMLAFAFLANLYSPVAVRLLDHKYPVGLNECRSMLLAPLIHKGMSRDTVYRILGDPRYQIVCKAGAFDWYPDFMVGYDWERKVDDVSWRGMTRK
jgi:hypothetical protein